MQLCEYQCLKGRKGDETLPPWKTGEHNPKDPQNVFKNDCYLLGFINKQIVDDYV